MSADFSGKVALVTGAGRGLGFAIAEALLAAGATVAVNDRTPEIVAAAIERLGGGTRLVPASADLRDAAGARQAVEAAAGAGRIDLLVNNAAVNIEKPIDETDDAHWDLHLAVVLKASFFTVQAALPWLAASRGCVINIASELGLHAIRNNVAYVAAKHGVLALTRALAVELAGAGIRVNALCPGTMDTELMQECAAASFRSGGLLSGLCRLSPARPARFTTRNRRLRPLPRLSGRGFHDRGGDSDRWRQLGGTALNVAAEFSGRRILVTGSTRGIGRATALLLHERGGEVVWHGRSRDAALRAAAETGGALAVGGDLADRAACRRIAAEAGEVDVLVNCAGILREAPVTEADEALWDSTIAVNLTAAWTLSRALLPGLRRRRGVIVNVASDAGLLGYPGCAAYCASKGALIGLTRALAVELAPDVRAVAVCPGPVETDMMREAVAAAPDREAALRNWSAATMLRRPATANEIAEAIAFAASARASYMTGDLLVISGGATAGRRVGS